MPWFAPMLSVNTSAITEIPAEKRRPVRIDGMASGTTTWRTKRRPPNPKLRADSTTRRSTLRTPLEVFRYMGKSVARPMRRTLAVSPMPNQMMKRKMTAG